MKLVIRQFGYLIMPLSLAVFFAVLLAARPGPELMQRIQEQGELVVVTLPSPTSFYEDQHGATGFDFHLAKGFANHMGVSLRVIPVNTLDEVYGMVSNGKAHMAAAHLAPTRERRQQVRYSMAYQQVSEKLIYRLGDTRPVDAEALTGKRIVVQKGGRHEYLLKALNNQHTFHLESIDASAEKLLTLVDEGHFDYTLVNANAYAIHRGLFPDLARAFNLNESGLAWAFPAQADQSLYQEAQRYLLRVTGDGTIAALEERFFGHAAHFNYYAARSFMRHLDSRLPTYIDTFREAATKQDFDWRLVAAMGYQESMWDPDAVSPTGVRGLMMLTLNTAAEMGISDRTDPIQSIRAGTAYLRKLYNRVPDRIAEQDRLWMAVAAYNVGFGHLEDARILTQRQGGNPDDWDDVRERLPLLRNPEYYRDTRHGYARGGAQAVIYVRHIRRYYDTLVWATHTERHGAGMLALAN